MANVSNFTPPLPFPSPSGFFHPFLPCMFSFFHKFFKSPLLLLLLLLFVYACSPVEVDQQAAVRACRSSGTKPGLEQRSTNGPARTGVSRKDMAELQAIAKTSKRKLSNRECVEQGGDENQPPQKRPPAKACSSGPGKKSSNMARKKLIAGQGKLTSFFRL